MSVGCRQTCRSCLNLVALTMIRCDDQRSDMSYAGLPGLSAQILLLVFNCVSRYKAS